MDLEKLEGNVPPGGADYPIDLAVRVNECTAPGEPSAWILEARKPVAPVKTFSVVRDADNGRLFTLIKPFYLSVYISRSYRAVHYGRRFGGPSYTAFDSHLSHYSRLRRNINVAAEWDKASSYAEDDRTYYGI